jgi:hypothetical protein
MQLDQNAALQVTGSIYSPIFYDYNNTGYYCDPASTSNFNATVATVGTFTNNGSSRVLYLKGSGNIIQFQDADGTDRWENVGRNGTYYVYKGYGTGSGYKWQIDDSGNHTFNGIVSLNTDIRTPILYDVNNTAYYADLNSTGDSIRAAGNITAYYSDMRLKKYLGKIENAVDKVKQLEGFYYEANEIAQKLGYKPKREVGVSAQSVQEVLPEIVADAPINSNYLTISYERLTPLLIEAIKEQQKEIDELKALVKQLLNK